MEQKNIFKPKYKYHPIFSLIVMTFVVFITLSLAKDNPAYYFGTAFFGLISIMFPFSIAREFHFSVTNVVMKRYLLPDRIIEYHDIKDIGNTLIKIKDQRSIPINQMKNQEELTKILLELIENRKIQPSQIEGKLIKSETLSQKALKFSIIPSFITSVIMEIILKLLFKSQIQFGFIFLLFFIIIYIGCYNFLKLKDEDEI